jgi:SAM-dependent methyltransferase
MRRRLRRLSQAAQAWRARPSEMTGRHVRSDRQTPTVPEFDRYADRYEELVARSIGFSGQGQSFFLEARARHLLDVVRRRVAEPAQVRALDVGCGGGLSHPYLTSLGALDGVDVSPSMIARARERNASVRYHVGDGTRLPFPDGVFDVTFTACVLHHVPPPARDEFARELGRVTRPGGLVVVFEHNPLNPLTRLAVSRCEFDEDAVLLGRGETRRLVHAARLRPVEDRYILFFPFRARAVDPVERALARLPLGAQYYVAAAA